MTLQMEVAESAPSRDFVAASDVLVQDSATLRRRAVRGGTLLFATRLATQVLSWTGALLVAGIVSPYDYGLLTAGMVLVGLADLLAEAGVGRALIQKDRLEPRDVAEGFTVSVLLSVALYVVLLVLARPAADFLETPEFALFLPVLALLVLLVPFRSIPLALLERNLQLGSQAAVHAVRALIQLGLVLALALAGFGYWALAAGVLAAGVVETLAVVYASGWRPRLRRPGLRARGLLGFGIHVSLASLLWFFYSHADQAILSKLAGPVALGYYALAFQLISLPVQKLTAHANQIAYPVFCRLQHDRRRLLDWYLRLTTLLACVGMPTLAGMALVADDAFALVFGERWLPAVTPFRLLSVAGMIMIFSNSLPPLFNSLGRPDINFRYTALCAVVFPLAFLLLGIQYGLIGICLVWLVLYPIVVGALVQATRKLSGLGLGDVLRVHFPILLGVLAMAGIVLSLQWSLSEVAATGPRLALTVAAGAATYVGIMVVFARHTILADMYLLLREIRS